MQDLRTFLDQFPSDMEVLETRCSDYGDMKLEDWSVRRLIDVRLRRGYVMRYPENDWRLTNEEYQQDLVSVGPVKEFLHFQGN